MPQEGRALLDVLPLPIDGTDWSEWDSRKQNRQCAAFAELRNAGVDPMALWSLLRDRHGTDLSRFAAYRRLAAERAEQRRIEAVRRQIAKAARMAESTAVIAPEWIEKLRILERILPKTLLRGRLDDGAPVEFDFVKLAQQEAGLDRPTSPHKSTLGRQIIRTTLRQMYAELYNAVSHDVGSALNEDRLRTRAAALTATFLNAICPTLTGGELRAEALRKRLTGKRPGSRISRQPTVIPKQK